MTQKAKSLNLPCGRPAPASKSDPRESKVLLTQMMGRLEKYINDQSLKKTEARGKILETIVYEARHFTALDLLAHLSKRHPDIGKATLYRNLPILVESGVIQEGPTDRAGQTLYELSDEEHHDHIVCLDCRNIFEFHDEMIEARQEQLAGKMSFALKDHRHVIFAACAFKKRSS